MTTIAENEWGFTWGPMTVQRLTEVEWKKDRGPHRVLGVLTDHHNVEVYVSPTGRSVRVFMDNQELT